MQSLFCLASLHPKVLMLLRRVVFNSFIFGCALLQFQWLANIGDDYRPPLENHFDDPSDPEPLFVAQSSGAPLCQPMTETDVSFTLVTQTSMDRLWMMEKQCERWGNHPISIAVGTNASKGIVMKALERLGCPRNDDLLTVHTYGDFDTHEAYPVNTLRNLALSGVQTTHAIVLDMDFLLQENTFSILNNFRTELASDPQTSLVIPAFEFRSLCDAAKVGCTTLHEALVPKTKQELLEFYLLGVDDDSNANQGDPTVAPFDSKKNIAGHGSTRYREWTTQNDTELVPIDCIASPRYEPYLVVRYCEDLPPFQEAYRGYGQNKMTWMQHLVRTGYRFYQAPTFVIHFPHKPSDARKNWDSQRKMLLRESGGSASDDPAVLYAKLKVNQISAKFQEWMNDNVPNRTVVSQQC